MKAVSVIYSVVSVIALGSLVSCANNYQIAKDYTGPTASIHSSSEQVNGVKGKGFYVSEVDGRTVLGGSPMATPYGGGMGVTLKDKDLKVPARQTTVTLTGATLYAADGAAMVDSIAGGARFVSGAVTFTPKPNGVYRVKGNLETKGQESVWLVDDKTGQVIGAKIVK